MEADKNPMPNFEGLRIADLVVGGVLAASRFIGHQADHLQHIGISERFQTSKPKVTTRMAQIALNFNGEGAEVE